MNVVEAKEALISQLKFPSQQVDIAERASFCCEYCGKDLLMSVDSYDSWQIDHIIPNGDDDLENLALSCKTCNFIKRHTKTEKLENAEKRESRINEARRIINERRMKKENTLMKVRELAYVIRQGKL